MSNAESRRVSPSNCNSRSRENCDESFRFFIPPSLVGCPKAVIRSEPRNGKEEMEGVCSGFANRTTAAEQRRIAARVHVRFCSTTEPTVMSRTARKPIKYGPKWNPIRLKRLSRSRPTGTFNYCFSDTSMFTCPFIGSHMGSTSEASIIWLLVFETSRKCFKSGRRLLSSQHSMSCLRRNLTTKTLSRTTVKAPTAHQVSTI